MDVLLSIYIIYINIPLLYLKKKKKEGNIYIFIHIYIMNTCTWYKKKRFLRFFGAIFFSLSRMVLSSLLTFSSTPYY